MDILGLLVVFTSSLVLVTVLMNTSLIDIIKKIILLFQVTFQSSFMLNDEPVKAVMLVFVILLLTLQLSRIIKIITDTEKIVNFLNKGEETTDSLILSKLKDILPYLFFMLKNKDEIIGDLIEQDNYMEELGSSNFKRTENMLTQIFVIVLSQIKTKFENIFSTNKKIDE